MENKVILSCESTADIPYAHTIERNIPVIFYSYSIDAQEYEDNMGRDSESLEKFYQSLDEGKMPSTSQINEFRYMDFFEEQLKKGDLIHIALGSGVTPSVNNAYKAADMLREKYPDRKVAVIDSYCAAPGFGLLVDEVADFRDKGATFEEIVEYAKIMSKKVHSQFFSTDLKFFKRSGRVSGAAATVASILGICPIMHLDETGHIIAYDKVRGKKNAISETVNTMLKLIPEGAQYSGRCYIGHSNCIDDCNETAKKIAETFPKLEGKIKIYDIGNIIASHCGPGTVAVFFVANERTSDK